MSKIVWNLLTQAASLMTKCVLLQYSNPENLHIICVCLWKCCSRPAQTHFLISCSSPQTQCLCRCLSVWASHHNFPDNCQPASNWALVIVIPVTFLSSQPSCSMECINWLIRLSKTGSNNPLLLVSHDFSLDSRTNQLDGHINCHNTALKYWFSNFQTILQLGD